MPRPTAFYPPTFDPPGAPVAASPSLDNIHCTRCGYLLRGLKADGQCPECGQSIAATRTELALREQAKRRTRKWCDSRLLGNYGDAGIEQESMARRRAVAAGAVGLMLVQGCLLVGYPDVSRLPPRGLSQPLSVAFIVIGLILAGSMLLIAVTPSVPDRSRLRGIARWGTRVAAVAVVGATAIPYPADHWVAWYDAKDVDDFSFAATVVAHVGAILLFHLLAAFAWQLRMRAVGSAFVFCMLLSVFAGAPILLLAGEWKEPFAPAFRFALIAALLVLAVAMVKAGVPAPPISNEVDYNPEPCEQET